PLQGSAWLRPDARLHGGPQPRRIDQRARRRPRPRSARLSLVLGGAGLRGVLPQRDGRAAARVEDHVRFGSRAVALVTTPIRGVLFDWGDTLFAPPDAARVIADVAHKGGVAVGPERAREIWDELWAKGKTPEELAKGRDLSSEAHRTVWTSLFQTAE